MPYEVIIGAAIALVAVVLLALRTNGGVVFFSVCAGSVLAAQIGDEASLLSSIFIKNGDINKSIMSAVLIVLPVVFSAIFLRGSVGASKVLLNLLPSVCAAGLLVLLVVPLLPPSVGNQVLVSDIWGVLQQYQPIILAVGVVSSIVLLWFTQRPHKKGKKHKS